MLHSKVRVPIAVLWDPDVLPNKTLHPIAVLLSPVVLKRKV